jgi:hypothetical protein
MKLTSLPTAGAEDMLGDSTGSSLTKCKVIKSKGQCAAQHLPFSTASLSLYIVE